MKGWKEGLLMMFVQSDFAIVRVPRDAWRVSMLRKYETDWVRNGQGRVAEGGGMTKWAWAHYDSGLKSSTLKWTGLCMCCSKTSGTFATSRGRAGRRQRNQGAMGHGVNEVTRWLARALHSCCEVGGHGGRSRSG